MVTISFESRYMAPKTCTYAHMHTAKTILLLSGYLPSEDDDDLFINMYTRETARVKLYR